MKYNIDGTPYSLESIVEILDQRFADQDFPHLSDLLGSDWIRVGQEFKTAAYEFAARIYKSAEE